MLTSVNLLVGCFHHSAGLLIKQPLPATELGRLCQECPYIAGNLCKNGISHLSIVIFLQMLEITHLCRLVARYIFMVVV